MLIKAAKHLLGIAGGMALLWGAGFLYLLATDPSARWLDGLGAIACLGFGAGALAGALSGRPAR